MRHNTRYCCTTNTSSTSANRTIAKGNNCQCRRAADLGGQNHQLNNLEFFDKMIRPEVSNLLWKRNARLLFTLNISVLLEMKEFLCKIINNILNNPAEEKFSRLKYNNTVLQNKVIKHNGGEEILLGAGFQKEPQPATGEMFLILPIMPLIAIHQEKELLDKLQGTIQWLENTVETCLRFHEEKTDGGRGGTFGEITAQALIQLELPTNKRSTGGFFLHETYQDIYSFACSYFEPERHPYVQLRIPRGEQFSLETDRQKTIEELKLFPQAKFIVTAFLPTQAPEVRMQEVHTETVNEVANQRKRAHNEKIKKQDERKAEEERRIRTLQQFQEDREKKQALASRSNNPDAEEKLYQQQLIRTIHKDKHQ